MQRFNYINDIFGIYFQFLALSIMVQELKSAIFATKKVLGSQRRCRDLCQYGSMQGIDHLNQCNVPLSRFKANPNIRSSARCLLRFEFEWLLIIHRMTNPQPAVCQPARS